MPGTGLLLSTFTKILLLLWTLRLLLGDTVRTDEVDCLRLSGTPCRENLNGLDDRKIASWATRLWVSAEDVTNANNIGIIERIEVDGDIELFSLAQESSDEDAGYETSFEGLGRSIVGRADQATTALANNIFQNDNVVPGSTNYYQFAISSTAKRSGASQEANEENAEESIDSPEDEEEFGVVERAATETTVYVTINTCLQPGFSTADEIPQLTLFVSASDDDKQPGPNVRRPGQIIQVLNEGYASVMVNTTSNVYIGVYGQPAGVTSGSWNYEVAASTDGPYHVFDPSTVHVYLVDSDRNASLLISRNLSSATPPRLNTSIWLDNGPPLSLFIQQNVSALAGLASSFCALKQHAQLSSGTPADGITTGLASYNNQPVEQQFYVPNLQGQTFYHGIIALAGTQNTAGGGGAVFGSQNFTTKQYANCQLLYNLTFCSSVAYSVPANPATYTDYASLAALYDNTTFTTYQSFNYSLSQIACTTTDTAQYSLAKNCTDCANAYKTWICAVSIPRCADWQGNNVIDQQQSFGTADSNTGQYIMPRNAAQSPIAATPDILPVQNSSLLTWLATNSSRNNYTISQLIQPGPYAEVLPCEDLCYDLVRNCPAALGFGCPYPGRGLEYSYGKKESESIGGGPTCNEPGAVWGLSGCGRLGVVGWKWVVGWVGGVVGVVLWVV